MRKKKEAALHLPPRVNKLLRHLEAKTGVDRGVLLNEAITVGLIDIENRLAGWTSFRSAIKEMGNGKITSGIGAGDAEEEVPDNAGVPAEPSSDPVGSGLPEESGDSSQDR